MSVEIEQNFSFILEHLLHNLNEFEKFVFFGRDKWKMEEIRSLSDIITYCKRTGARVTFSKLRFRKNHFLVEIQFRKKKHKEIIQFDKDGIIDYKIERFLNEAAKDESKNVK